MRIVRTRQTAAATSSGIGAEAVSSGDCSSFAPTVERPTATVDGLGQHHRIGADQLLIIGRTAVGPAALGLADADGRARSGVRRTLTLAVYHKSNTGGKRSRRAKGKAVFVKAMPLVTAVHQRQFELESDMLSELVHPNILHFVGLSIAASVSAAYFVYEYVPSNLKTYLLKMKEKQRIADASNTSRRADDRLAMLVLCRQAAAALCYLHRRHVVHADVRASNCLLTRRHKVARRWPMLKLVPFATPHASGQAAESDRWLPPECVTGAPASVEANVWSLAVLMWEVFMTGDQPHGQFDANGARQAIVDGVELEQPERTCYRTYGLLKACWRRDARSRPDAATVLQSIDDIVLKAAGTLKMFK